MKQPSILIVEDEAIIALDLEHRLTDLGFEVVGVCASGETAVQTAQSTHPDLVLMDLHLNGRLDGIETAEIIQAGGGPPVLFLTAFADDETLSRVGKSAAYGYLLKPFEERELIANIEMTLYKHRMDAELHRAKQELERRVQEQAQVEAQLRKSETLYRLLLEASPDGIVLTEVDGTIVLCSRQAAISNGYDQADDLVGLNGVDLIAPEDHVRVSANIETAIANNGTQRIEFTGMRRDGTRYPLEISVSVLREEDGRPKQFLWVGRDISERKAAEVEILRQNRQLETLRKIGLELTAELDPLKLLASIVDRAVKLIGGEFGGVYLYRPELDAIELCMSAGPRVLPIGTLLRRGEGLSGRVWEALRPMIVADYGRWEGRAGQFQRLGAVAVIAAPILSGDDFLGVVNISTTVAHQFTARDRELLVLFASQAGVAIRNARFVEQQRAQRRRADALARAASCANTRIDTTTMLTVLCEETTRALQIPAAAIRLVNPAADALEFAAGYFSEAFEAACRAPLRREQFSRAFSGSRLPVILTTPQNGAPAGDEVLHPLTTQATAGIFFENEIVGALEVVAAGERRFSPDELTFLQAMTEQAGVIMDRERWQDRSRRQLHRLESLHQLTTRLREARNSREIVPMLVEKAILAAGAAAGDCFRLAPPVTALGDEPVGLQSDRADTGGRTESGKAIYLSGRVLEGLLRTPRRLSLPEMATSAAGGLHAALPAAFGPCAAVDLLPLQASGTLFGVLVLGFGTSEPLNAEDQRLLDSIVEIGGNALQRAGLMETLEKSFMARTRALALLYHIAALSNQIPVFSQMLESALAELMSATEASAGWIQMAAPGDGELYLAAHSGLSDDLPAELRSQPQRHPFLRRVLAQPEPLLLTGVAADPDAPQALRSRAGETYLGAAIRVNRRLLGIVSLLRSSENPFSLDEIALVGAVADQLGIAAEAARLRQEAEQAAVGEERQRLARDLHDSVSQSLFSLNLMAESYRRRLKNARPQEVETWMGELGDVAHQSLKEMRLLVYELRPGIVAHDGLANAVRRRLDAVEKRAGIIAGFQAEGDLMLPERTAFEVYNLICEALNNSLKHAAARHVEVRLLRRNNGCFEVEVIDDGTGFDVQAAGRNGGIGLSSMRERAERLGGVLQIDSSLNGGTRLRFTVEGLND